jgi:hypothetical protein
MKKLSKLTRLPFIPEMNQDSVLLTIIFLVCCPLATTLLFSEKISSFFLISVAYFAIVYYVSRLMVAKDLIFRNFIEFRGEITEFFPSEQAITLQKSKSAPKKRSIKMYQNTFSLLHRMKYEDPIFINGYFLLNLKYISFY